MVSNKIESLMSFYKVNDYMSLVNEISDNLNEVLRPYNRINSISLVALSSFLTATASISYKSFNNFSYKKNGIDLLSDVANKLNIMKQTSDRGEFTFKKDLDGVSVNLGEHPGDYLNSILQMENVSDHRVFYKCWKENGRKVGKSQLWPSMKLVRLLREYKLKDLEWPTSHAYPVRFNKLLIQLFQKTSEFRGNKARVEDWMLNLWRYESQAVNHSSKRKACGNTVFPIEFSDKIQAHQKTLPYFYILVTPNGSKIGAANKTLNRFSPNDRGAIFQLEYIDSNEVATQIECEFALMLKQIFISPVPGKRDHYRIAASDMIKMAFDFLRDNHHVKRAILTTDLN